MSWLPAYTVVGDGPHLALVVHGILGSGNNWAGFARRLVAARPDWRLALVDLRNHGDSPPADPPHTVAACAADLAGLVAEVGPPEAIIGHSYGGKVALAYARDHGVGLTQAWSLDSPPGSGGVSGGEEVGRVLDTARALTPPFAERAAVIAHFEAAGFSPGIARWMTTNVRRTPEGLRWRFDLDAIEAMLADYWRVDLWPFIEAGGPLAVHLVRGARSDRWTPAELARFADHPLAHVLPEAGHWVHVDAPRALLAVLTDAL